MLEPYISPHTDNTPKYKRISFPLLTAKLSSHGLVFPRSNFQNTLCTGDSFSISIFPLYLRRYIKLRIVVAKTVAPKYLAFVFMTHFFSQQQAQYRYGISQYWLTFLRPIPLRKYIRIHNVPGYEKILCTIRIVVLSSNLSLRSLREARWRGQGGAKNTRISTALYTYAYNEPSSNFSIYSCIFFCCQIIIYTSSEPRRGAIHEKSN